jgi:hypothetical protein
MRLLAGLVCTVAIIGTFSVQPAGAQGVMQGYQDSQMRQLCIQAMQNYMNGAGPPPPQFCGAPAAPQPQYQSVQPAPVRVPCDTRSLATNGMANVLRDCD